jgi:hypothetical protein
MIDIANPSQRRNSKKIDALSTDDRLFVQGRKQFFYRVFVAELQFGGQNHKNEPRVREYQPDLRLLLS